MIDSVLKGTGNSRFLKSAVPAGTSWADALAMLQAGTFPIDFNGINTEGFQQVGTPLNKANLLKDATAAQIGLPPSTTPDGMFQALSKTGDLHVWRKTVTTAQEIPAGYTLGDAQSIRLVLFAASSGVTVRYADSISVNDGGAASLKNSSEISLQSSSAVNTLNSNCKGKFVEFSATGMNKVSVSGIVYIQANSVFSEPDNYIYASNAQLVNSYPLTPAGTTTTYPVSTNPNAYQEGDDAKAAGYVLGDVVTGQFKMSTRYPTNGYYYRYDSNVSVADDGTVSLSSSNPSQISFDEYNGGQSYANNCLAEISGKFVYLFGRNSGTDAPDSKPPFNSVPSDIVYIPPDATLTWTEGGALDGFTLSKYQPVTGYAAIPASTTIEYLGKLGDKARVQVVSYVGTGALPTETTPFEFTLDVTPRLVTIAESITGQPSSAVEISIAAPQAGIGATITGSASSNGRIYIFYVKANGKTLKLFGDNVPRTPGTKYIITAIG